MTIKQLLAMPIGQKVSECTFSIKTAKKKWQLPSGEWMHLVLLADQTGEILADVRIGKYIPLIANSSPIKIITADIRVGELANKPIKKLWVDKFALPTITADEYMDGLDTEAEEWTAIVKSKVRMHLVCADKRASKIPDKTDILKWVEFIITGE
jgi:hypothetical protein